jgi:hypothetical protein
MRALGDSGRNASVSWGTVIHCKVQILTHTINKGVLIMFEFEEYCKHDKACPYWKMDCKIKNKENGKCPIYGLQKSGIKPLFHETNEKGYFIGPMLTFCQYCGEATYITNTAENVIYGNICQCCLSEFKERGYPTHRWPHPFKKREGMHADKHSAIYLCGEGE